MQRWWSAALALSLLGTFTLEAQENKINFTVTGGKADAVNTPVCVPLSLPAKLAQETAGVVVVGDRTLDAQLTAPGILTESVKASGSGLVRRDLHFIMPHIKAGQTVSLQLAVGTARQNAPHFYWDKETKNHVDLYFEDDQGKHPVLRYMCRPYDDSSADKRNLSYKVFHHLYDFTGKRFLTNGGFTNEGATDPKKLLYPHHRGIQMGFNKCSYNGGKKKADTWHCQKDDYQSHEGYLDVEAGQVLGRHRVAVAWHGDKKEVFAKEERELTAYNVKGGYLIDFASRVKTTGGPVKLDGDPQHAGFQFRAHNDVAALTAKQTYYLRPDGKGKPGETRNWDPKTKKGPVDLPWNAMSFVLDGKRYTVCYLDHPSNPHEARYSERDYGRFGCYFEYEVTKDRPLVVNYRLWVQEGEMTGEQVQALSSAFTAGTKAAVK